MPDYLYFKGVAIINASPVGNCLLAGRDLPDWHPAIEVTRQCARSAHSFAKEKGFSLGTYVCISTVVKYCTLMIFSLQL